MHGLGIVIPNDFLSKSISAMQNLRASDRHNILYGLAVGLGTTRPDNSDSFIPTKRMPMGLLEYLTKFFTSTHLSQASSMLLWFNIIHDVICLCRMLFVLLIIVFGVKLCTTYLGRNGTRFIRVHYGVLILWPKVMPLSTVW